MMAEFTGVSERIGATRREVEPATVALQQLAPGNPEPMPVPDSPLVLSPAGLKA